MDVQYKEFGFYNVDVDYLKYLNSIDSEVEYDEGRHYERKPFLGLILTIDAYSYFVPLSSRKSRFAQMRSVGYSYYLITEEINADEKRENDIISQTAPSDTKCIRILAKLDIRKMVPVPDGTYHKINFRDVSDSKYRELLQKEYKFCVGIKEAILRKVGDVYRKQKNTGKIHFGYCNFTLLEKACDHYKCDVS